MTAKSAPERSFRLARRESAVDEARRFAEDAATYCSPECQEAVTLAVCELGENVVKYGAPASGLEAGSIGVRIEGGTIQIRAVNRVDSVDDAERVAETIGLIARTGTNVRDLYQARLRELFENPDLPRTRLGLLRTAFEGGFRLTCRVHGVELEIMAERPCEQAG